MFKKSNKNPVQGADTHKNYWKILIVDDEPEVHSITKVALSEFSYDDKDVEMISAYSGAEAKEVCQNEPDIALIYLDVVMETDTAGLEVVQYIRNELKNNFVRIILRTGQPGQAPEREVIVNYDINDYKEKTLLDSGKLFTSTYSALRAYNDIMNVERSRVMLDRYRSGLEKVIESTANLFELRSLQNFANGLLVQLGSLLHIDRDTILLRSHGYTVVHNDGEQFELLAATGDLGKRIASEPEVHHTSDLLPPKVNQDLLTCLQTRKSIVREDVYVGYFPTKSGKN
ncbi:MAG: DUF3369 domain-containing protein [Pseudomonadales bacterium]|nr:DUF3369 domain-containing protein [Pseudomonadales bacterium]